MKHSRRWKRRLLFPHILHRQAVVLHGHYVTKALHSRLPYAKCITRHVCARHQRRKAREIPGLRGHVFTPSVPFRESVFICLRVNVCGILHGDRGHVQTQTLVCTCHSLCLYQQLFSCEGVCTCLTASIRKQRWRKESTSQKMH